MNLHVLAHDMHINRWLAFGASQEKFMTIPQNSLYKYDQYTIVFSSCRPHVLRAYTVYPFWSRPIFFHACADQTLLNIWLCLQSTKCMTCPNSDVHTCIDAVTYGVVVHHYTLLLVCWRRLDESCHTTAVIICCAAVVITSDTAHCRRALEDWLLRRNVWATAKWRQSCTLSANNIKIFYILISVYMQL